MRTRIFTLLVAFLAIAGNAVWGQGTSFSGGEGTEGDPYLISSAKDLKALASSVNDDKEDYEGKYFILTHDIELDSDEEWTPIGGYPLLLATTFKGIFNGNGKTISGFYIKTSHFQGDGLFGCIGDIENPAVDNIGIIKNLTLTGTVEVTGVFIGGGICGMNYGIIQDCISNVSFDLTTSSAGTSGIQVGGICGANEGIVNGCTNNEDISINDMERTLCFGGGICGTNRGTIEKSYNMGNLSANNASDGIGGICGNMNNQSVINNCYNSGTLTLTCTDQKGGNVGGIGVATGGTGPYSSTVTIKNCHNYGAIIGNATSIGGIYTEIFNVDFVVENCYYINTIESTEEEEGVEPKSADAFANGEVLYLLQQNNLGVWKQGEEGYPVFIGDEEEETILYKVTFDYNYEGSPEAIVNYLEAGETVTFPTVEREGYTFMNWSTDATGETPVEDITSITLTSDMTYYAQWQSSETEEPGDDDDEDQGNTSIHKPQRPIKYYNIYIDTICPGLDVEVSKDVVQEGHQVSAYLTIQAECDTTGMRFEYKRDLFGYWKDLKELEGVQPGEYIIKNIYTDIYIRALDATLPEEEPTGIDDLEGVKAYAKEGSIYVYTPNREEVTIISMSGAIIKHAEQVGLQSYSVSRGIYIVRVGEKVFKLKN